jgi:spore germination protein GerM
MTLVLVAAVATGCTHQRLVLNDNPRAMSSGLMRDFSQHRFPGNAALQVCFVKPIGENLQYVSVPRPVGSGSQVKQAVSELLRGPDGPETKQGLASEIPRGTVLISVDEEPNKVELNLSKRFAQSGGMSSVEARLEQVRRTLSDITAGKKIYLDVEGNRLVEAGGEGLEVKQPIN